MRFSMPNDSSKPGLVRSRIKQSAPAGSLDVGFETKARPSAVAPSCLTAHKSALGSALEVLASTRSVSASTLPLSAAICAAVVQVGSSSNVTLTTSKR